VHAGLGIEPVKVVKIDWFADLHYHSSASNLTGVGGLSERGENHACGVDQFWRVESLNQTKLTLAPRRSIDPEEIQSRETNVKRVSIDHILINFR
jgi:hypothetical protein